MIKLRDVSKSYGDEPVLEHAGYDFPERGLVCLMGASGCGKTTLLNLIAGFDTDYTGEISVGGVALGSLDADALCRYRRDNIGFVFQNYHLLTGYTVLKNLMLASPGEPDGEAKEQRAAGLLRQVVLSGKLGQKVETLSGGQKQRAAIARALMGDPAVILADEPTGSLGRNTSDEIMQLLHAMSKERLVIVITHDARVCAFADEIIQIRGRKIVSEGSHQERESGRSLRKSESKTRSLARHALSNLRVRFLRYFAAAPAVAIGLFALLLSLSFDNVMERSISEFKAKNTAFNSGYIKGSDDGSLLEAMLADGRITDAYHQYKLYDVELEVGGRTETLAEKYPMSKTAESLSYGVMPRKGCDEIALSPSLAMKFDTDIQSLLGKTVTLKVNGAEYALTVCGIYNAGYDDFFVSQDVERRIYETLDTNEPNYSTSYEVRDFGDVAAVSDDLALKGIEAQTAAEEVSALLRTFARLDRLFTVVSVLILAVALFLAGVLLFRMQSTRYGEAGLLSALGYDRGRIANMLRLENLLLAAMAAVIDLALAALAQPVSAALDFPVAFTPWQTMLSLSGAFLSILLLGALSGRKLIRTESAAALRRG